MARTRYIFAIDQGTTGSRAILYDPSGRIAASAYQEFPQIFPNPGWVEHDPARIWSSVLGVVRQALTQVRASASDISAIGLTNQRETIVLWDKYSGRPVSNAIVWQDRRTSSECERLRGLGYEKMIREKTGLVLDPYFSATKAAWLLRHLPGISAKARRGEILLGTIDSWLLWKLTEGRVHATDPTNACRTQLFNIHTRCWDSDLLKLFSIPHETLPKVLNSGGYFGEAEGFLKGVPIFAMIGDQQAALYGQGCYKKGELKNTYGTGCFAMMNAGRQIPRKTPQGLLLTLACDEKGRPVYALEGAVFIGGAVIQWLRDGLKIIDRAQNSEGAARSVKDSGGVVFIPAFTGLGSPHWDSHVRGMISGITRGTTRAHIIRAALESIAHQSADMIDVMRRLASIPELKVDGGASRNFLLMQFQSDISRLKVRVSSQTESTAWGAAKLAGYSAGVWKDLTALDRHVRFKDFFPEMSLKEAAARRAQWGREIKRACL